MEYERRKHDGTLPIVGVNTFLSPDASHPVPDAVSRATAQEKESQIARLQAFHDRHRAESPQALARLEEVAASGGNTFAALMDAVRTCSLGQITDAFFEVGGQYRRSM